MHRCRSFADARLMRDAVGGQDTRKSFLASFSRSVCRRASPGAGLVLLVASLVLSHAGALTHPEDKKALFDLYNSTQGDQWREGYRWTRGFLKDLDPCDDHEFFKGLVCSGSFGDPDRHAKILLLSSMMLNGTLPTTIGNLSGLEELYLTQNNIGGTLPESICRLDKLNTLDIPLNRLTGTIPSCINKMTRLFKFDVRTNLLEGSIPKEFGDLQLLQHLYLSENLLTGMLISPRHIYEQILWAVMAYASVCGRRCSGAKKRLPRMRAGERRRRHSGACVWRMRAYASGGAAAPQHM